MDMKEPPSTFSCCDPNLRFRENKCVLQWCIENKISTEAACDYLKNSTFSLVKIILLSCDQKTKDTVISNFEVFFDEELKKAREYFAPHLDQFNASQPNSPRP